MNNYMIKYATGKRRLTFNIPTESWDAYRKRVEEMGFRSNIEVLRHLASYLWRQENGCFVPKAAQKILSCIPDTYQYTWGKIKKIRRRYWFNEEDAVRFTSLYEGCTNTLFGKLVKAFISADASAVKSFRKRIHADRVVRPVNERLISAYISFDQYDQVRDMARSAGLKITQLLRLVLNVFAENEESHRVPEPLSSVFTAIMQIEGSTLRSFKNEIAVCVTILDKAQYDKVGYFIKRYSVPGERELVRRLVLFLLHSRELSGSFLPDISQEEDSNYGEEFFDENESYWNDRMSRREFVSDLYK